MTSHLTAKDYSDRLAVDVPIETSKGPRPVESPSEQTESAETLDEVRLLGQPPLRHHLTFVHDNVAGGAAMSRAEIADDWRRANDYYYDLEESEGGIADQIEVWNLDPSLRPLAAEIETDPRYQYTFDTFPTSFAMVELDRLVVYQTHITKQFTDRLQERLGPEPDPETLFRFCQPSATPESPVQIREVGSRRYVFSSESTDFRQHEPSLLKPDQISDHKTFGPLSAMVGLGVGFGSNFLTAIRADDRLLLHNGYHRAYAMRALGITHAPCIIQTITRRDELEVAAKSVVADDPKFYFATPRPPLLKDFFDPKICKSFQVYKTLKMIEVTFQIKDFEVRV